jgi:hypothetical protein
MRSRRCGQRRHEHLRGGSLVSDRGMRPDGVVVPSPALNDDLRLPEGVEDLAIEKLVTQAGIEALDEAVLPWTAPLDVSGPCAHGCDPVLHGSGDELGSVVGADMAGNTAQDEEVGQQVDDVDRPEPARHTDGQALVGELVDDVEHAYPAPVVGAVLDKVVGPDVIAVLGPEPHTGAVVEPQAAALQLPCRNLQPLASPDPLHPLVIDEPASPAQQFGDLAIAIAAILPGQLGDVGGQPLFIVTAVRDLALGRAMLAERRTGTPLGDGQLPSNMLDTGAATRGA